MNRAISILFLFGLLFVCGCDASPPSREELGTIIFDESKVPGTDQPYTLPEYLKKAPPAPEPEGRKPGD